jgi:hypothetical protein
MDKSKIKQFRLFKQNLPTHEPDPRYWYNTINTDNFSQFLNHINSSINFHHQDLNWDNTPTLEVVYDRLAFGSQCHLWMYEEKCLGWHWTNPNCVTLDWKSHYQDINDNEIYIGGALVSREYKPDRGNSAWMFYRQGFEYSFDYTNTDTMYLYSDDWNRASAMLCYKSGFTSFNFIK